MNRQDILDAIKAKDTLRNDDFLQLGLMHKQLPRGERNWQWLTDVTGWPGTCENYRCFVKACQHGASKHRKEFESKVSEIKSDAPTEEQIDAMHELYKERQRLRDERTNLNRKLRDESRIERLRDTIAEVIPTLNELPKCKWVGSAFDGVEAVALFSDMHIGMEIDDYCNKYNLKIARARVDKWVADVIKYCKRSNVIRLNVVNLGDCIHGIIHDTLRIESEFDAVEQVMQASEIISQALNKLQEASPEVIYRSCSDNHSRMVADKHQSLERENYFRLIDWFVEERLKGTNVKFAHDNLSISMGKFRLLNGKLVMFAHGHMNKPQRAFQEFIGATEEYVHYVLLGHYHEEKVKFFQNMKVFVNGSICGADQFAESIRKYTKPAQTLLIFEGDDLINHSIGLDIREVE